MHGYVTKLDPGSQMPSSLVLVKLARHPTCAEMAIELPARIDV
jgi:hypothetical protein